MWGYAQVRYLRFLMAATKLYLLWRVIASRSFWILSPRTHHVDAGLTTVVVQIMRNISSFSVSRVLFWISAKEREAHHPEKTGSSNDRHSKVRRYKCKINTLQWQKNWQLCNRVLQQIVMPWCKPLPHVLRTDWAITICKRADGVKCRQVEEGHMNHLVERNALHRGDELAC